MVPAAAGLIVLSLPIVTLLFQHGQYHFSNSQLTSLALQLYAYQLPFVAIDQLLQSAFYARKNTITPVVVGFVCFGGYLAVALPFWQTIGMPALVFANTVQNSLHAIILLILLRVAIGSIHIRQMLPALLKICLATLAMVAVGWGGQLLLGQLSFFRLGENTSLIARLLMVIIVGGLAAGVYIGMVILLKVEEVGLVKSAVLAKLGKR